MCRLRIEGYSYRAIAEHLGLTLKTVELGVQRAIRRIPHENAEELLTIELERLDEAYRRCQVIVDAAHVTVSNGRLVMMDGVPIPDDAPVLAAVDRMLKISDRRSKLLGLDAPVRSRVEVVTDDMAQQLISQMQAEIDRYTREASPELESAEESSEAVQDDG
jgi:hypothetical protein